MDYRFNGGDGANQVLDVERCEEQAEEITYPSSPSWRTQNMGLDLDLHNWHLQSTTFTHMNNGFNPIAYNHDVDGFVFFIYVDAGKRDLSKRTRSKRDMKKVEEMRVRVLGVGRCAMMAEEGVAGMRCVCEDDGGFNKPSVAKKKSGCWGTIANIPKILEKDSVSFSNHFHRSRNPNGVLKWSWSLEPSGVYSVGSLRCHIDKLSLPASDGIWSWNPPTPGKLNILAWRICHSKLPTMVNLSKIGICSSNLFRICHGAPESKQQIFLECADYREVWQLICKWWRLLDYPLVSTRDLLQCKGNIAGHQRLAWIHKAIMVTFKWVIEFKCSLACSNFKVAIRAGLCGEISLDLLDQC
ncbi:unnamed protein product [Lactuca saligna]|uniref:Reverse transcriptase zinc-binding domain-containing protein n=1 Tax=Lactuca saligna TaxID=75948 RepID=A0AA35ZZ98_LACSI|nr:unnamed protein product [Lactuca saligna]